MRLLVIEVWELGPLFKIIAMIMSYDLISGGCLELLHLRGAGFSKQGALEAWKEYRVTEQYARHDYVEFS